MSEIVARYAIGVENCHFQENGYIPEKEWDEYAYKKSQRQLHQQLSEMYDLPDEAETVTIQPLKVGSTLSFSLDKIDLFANPRLEIEACDFPIETIMGMTIEIKYSGRGRCFTMLENLFICHLFKKHTQLTDKLIIPLCFCDIFPEKQIPLYLVPDGSPFVYIRSYDLSNQCQLSCQNVRIPDNHRLSIGRFVNYNIVTMVSWEKIIVNNQRIFPLFNHICKIFLFTTDNTSCYIEQISMSLNGLDPIIWNTEDILPVTVAGRRSYVVSLVPNVYAINDIKKLWLGKNMDGLGINFSRIDGVNFKVNTNLPDQSKFKLTICSLHTNVQVFGHGLTGLRYSADV
jgi:hypothetical protein